MPNCCQNFSQIALLLPIVYWYIKAVRQHVMISLKGTNPTAIYTAGVKQPCSAAAVC